MKNEIKKLPNSEAEIICELASETLESKRTEAITELKKDYELPGFRKGHVPDNIFLEKVPEMIILEEMAEMAINEAYPKLIEEHKLDPIGRPDVSITKLAKGSPLGFTIKTALVPEVKLPDYKKIAKEAVSGGDDVLVTEEEVEESILEIRKMRAPKIATDGKVQPSRDTNTTVDPSDNQGEAESRTEAPNDDSGITKNTGASGAGKPALPELTDEFVKSLGNFQNVAEFREKLRENIKLEKERTAKEKKRMKLLDALAEKSEVDLPKIIIEEEKNKLIYQLRHDIERMGMKFEDYLKNAGKTEDDIKKEWESEAIKRAKIQFIVTEISVKENISPTEDELGQELKHLLEHNKDINESRARLYLSSLLTNQKVMEFLENQK